MGGILVTRPKYRALEKEINNFRVLTTLSKGQRHIQRHAISPNDAASYNLPDAIKENIKRT